MNNCTVSVVMITYNHERYIRQAIESVLMQVCSFTVELIVCNDSSPDDTDRIVNDIMKTHPNGSWIKYYNNEKNIGMMPNFLFALSKVNGKYIALCDGDDYWLDPKKLQHQHTLINTASNCIACFDNAEIVSHEGEHIKDYYVRGEVREFKKSEMILKGGSTFPTSSLFYKNVIKSYPDFFIDSHAGDSCLLFLLLDRGHIVYNSMITTAYRKHATGIYTSSNDKFMEMKKSMILYKKVNKYFHNKYDEEIGYAIQKQLNVIFNYSGFFNFKNIELLDILSFKDLWKTFTLKFNKKLKLKNGEREQ